MSDLSEAVTRARTGIRKALEPLSDEDYVAALEDLIDVLQVTLQAKLQGRDDE